MDPIQYKSLANTLLMIADQIWEQEPMYFSTLTPSQLQEIGAVYFIAHRDTDEVLYVGRTVNLRRRMYTNHLMGNKSTARLKKYLIEDPQLPQVTDYTLAKRYIQEHCYFKYIQITDSRQRGLVEGGIGFVLDVRYMEKEH